MNEKKSWLSFLKCFSLRMSAGSEYLHELNTLLIKHHTIMSHGNETFTCKCTKYYRHSLATRLRWEFSERLAYWRRRKIPLIVLVKHSRMGSRASMAS